MAEPSSICFDNACFKVLEEGIVVAKTYPPLRERGEVSTGETAKQAFTPGSHTGELAYHT